MDGFPLWRFGDYALALDAVWVRPSTSSLRAQAKQSIAPHQERMDCFVAEFTIGPAEGGTRWLLAMTSSTQLSNDSRLIDVNASAIIEL